MREDRTAVPDVRGSVNPAQIMKSEKEAIGGIWAERYISLAKIVIILQLLTERMIKGRGSEMRNNDEEGFFLGTQVPVTRSKPSYGRTYPVNDPSMHGKIKSFLTCLAPSRKLFFKYLRSDLTPSSNAPFLVRLFVLVKSDFNAPEPPYAFAIASAWSAHTTHHCGKHINQQRKM